MLEARLVTATLPRRLPLRQKAGIKCYQSKEMNSLRAKSPMGCKGLKVVFTW